MKRSLKIFPFYENISNEFFKYLRFLKKIFPNNKKSIFKKNKFFYKDVQIVYEKITNKKNFRSIDEDFFQKIDR